MSSRRRLYLNLKQSVTKLFKTPAHYLKEITGKQSIFEKPYLDDDYRAMHLNLPVARWKRPEFDPGGIWPLPRKHTFIFDDGICSFFGQTGDCGETISLDGYIALTPLGTLNRKYVWSAESSNPAGAQIEEIELSSGGLSASVKVKLADDFTGTVTVCAKASLAAGAFLKEIAYEVPAFLGRVRICPGWIPSFDYARKNLPPIYEVREWEREWDCGCVDLEVTCACEGAIWDDDNSADTVATSSSCPVGITNAVGQRTWVVSGTGAWLDSGFTKTSLTNSAGSATIYTDANACGTIAVTVCGATGYIRCTTGTWVLKADACPSPGPHTARTGLLHERVIANTKVEILFGLCTQCALEDYTCASCGCAPTCIGENPNNWCRTDICMPFDCMAWGFLGSIENCCIGIENVMGAQCFKCTQYQYFEWGCT